MPAPGYGYSTGLTIGINPTGSQPTGGPSIIDRGIGILEDLIRAKLIPGDTSGGGGGGGNAVPGNNLVPGASNCPSGSFDIFGKCLDLVPGGSVSGGGMSLSYGEAVNGRYGPALVPARVGTEVRRCPRGAVLGNDGLCYNKRDLRKSDRAWVPARKPLLTGGDLNAISRASRAANRMKVQQKRLQKLGLLPKPKSARRAPRGRRGPAVINIDND